MVQNGNGGMSMATDEQFLTKGKRLERYIIKEKLGEGGFGQVFRGFDEKLNRDVAIKVLPRNNLSLLEGQIIAKLDNPHIVKIHDVLEGSQSSYLIIEYIPHSSIMQQNLSLDDILDLGIQVCNGLSEIHAHGFVHQDIKPGNILREARTGKCKITDFGIAAKTKRGQREIIGTPKFMAPEQRRGGRVDQRTDIYGLAKVISALIHHNEITVVPAKLGQILRQAAHSQPNQRYDNVQQFKEALIKLQVSLGSWHLMEQVMPELGDGVLKFKDFFGKKKLIATILNSVLAALATIIVMGTPLVALAAFYHLEFQLYVAPLLVGLIGAYSLPLALCVLLLLALPPLISSWASLGVIFGLVALFMVRWIYRYPLIFIGLILATLWSSPLFILALPIIAGFYYGFFPSLLAGVWLPITYFMLDKLPLTVTYQSLINTPMGLTEGNWLVASFGQISAQEIWEILSLLGEWIHHPTFDYGVLGLILGLGAALVGRRGKFGLFLYAITTGLGFAFAVPYLLWQWAVIMIVLVVSVLIRDHMEKKPKKTGQIWNKPTLACK